MSRAYQELADEGVVERRRGLGMFVNAGAKAALGSSEREAFLREEWPGVVVKIKRLGLTKEELLKDVDDEAVATKTEGGPR